MKPDQERVKTLLSQTVVLLCKNGLHFEKELRIEGLIGITVDHESVFIVHINESLADFATDNAAAPFSTENCNDVMEMTKLKKSSTSGTEADAGKASIPDEVSRPFVSDVMSNSQELNVGKEEPLLNDDVTEIKAELDSEAEADDVVLVESDAEQDVENAAETHLATGALEVSNPASRRNFRNRFHPETFPRNKRRRLALPAPVNNTPSSNSDRNYAMKIEPVSSPYLGSHQEQNMVYDDSYSEQKWENSDSMFGCTDRGVAEDLPGCSSWEGFDHQPREMTSADSFPQNNETYHESAFGAAALPLNSLDSIPVRKALVEHIVLPHVLNAGCQVEAFQIVWRKNDPSELAEAWSKIHNWREDCDGIMRTVGRGECLFFFSSVAGLYNKSKVRSQAGLCDIHPAISYYVVVAAECSLGFSSFSAPMKLRFGDAETKQILSRVDGEDGLNLRHLTAPLFAALKDCGSSYVRDKMYGATLSSSRSSAVNSDATIAKLVVTNQGLIPVLSHSYKCMKQASPSLSLQLVC